MIWPSSTSSPATMITGIRNRAADKAIKALSVIRLPLTVITGSSVTVCAMKPREPARACIPTATMAWKVESNPVT